MNEQSNPQHMQDGNKDAKLNASRNSVGRTHSPLLPFTTNQQLQKGGQAGMGPLGGPHFSQLKGKWR